MKMTSPQLSIIIPTYNRPGLLPQAVRSALAQTFQDLEVIVVDDASDRFPELPDDPRLRVIHLEQSRGGAGARNVGTEAARGRWVSYLDDDDSLLPHMAEVSLAALSQSSISPPVAVISGIEKVTPDNKVVGVRIPPTRCPHGGHFFLEPIAPGRSYLTKQTLVVERATVLRIGGWDQNFRSRVHSELFLRLNPACTIIGIPDITYRLRSHDGPRVSGNAALRQESFHRLVQKHATVFEAHPQAFAQFLLGHASTSWRLKQYGPAISAFVWASRLSPLSSSKTLVSTGFQQLKHQLLKVFSVRRDEDLTPSNL
jgi:hypothetical protein